MLRLALVLKRHLPRLAGLAMIPLIRTLFWLARRLGTDRASRIGGRLVRTVGPFLPAHRTAMANLAAAFPDLDPAARRALAAEAWDNLGRTGAEYAHLHTLFDADDTDPSSQRMQVSGEGHFADLRDDGKPGLIFSAHLANWELPAICAARYGLDATAIFRPPNDAASARLVQEVRRQTMGGLAAAGQGAVFAMQGVVERGGHLGQLIDQHFTRGVVVEFFGRPVLVNPLLGKLARHYECPVHGVRVVRREGARFALELTPPLDLPRDAKGEIDVQGAMQAMTRVVEDWIRENPGQWLWMHRRWRPAMLPKPKAPATSATEAAAPAT
ncbi:lipid A biosynthesis lauroyl acyltransferase [Methylobacterium sp. Leaf469]|uniref:lipid A biosynthesis lauroyl acyltransferase n=1 Tax=unclassified Methylobacterium TaxID=2615210 RepID=UPI0006FF3EE9|nr:MULTISPECIES: lipid A biosynthesis lauroyl acyltransferase [unclassified Methylobacterium]USU31783.1 lipid A biosynthesis lauroyl acyltransferase [Methylobacterium sp. OTU13CASTA1]KQO70472.1 lipid A biosynthesis lauroyl acyltransferase [Methylobacterium sp. Leaf87]KQP32479.1 lipid A biosynthesis lauroyl acyltransferase [Methylobacterium sp. Leaf102]KQP33009.1 lipid A biosynthesis lauroyl acyltransferase [Methylobacterium sp. Leaf100]KQU02022.1 lipid A biosynthesis lauroyl acyltransferase [M